MMQLAPYAARPEHSRGRRHDEPAAFPRTEYQRDRDRIIHSSAFRRLEYKTQVFVNHEGDLYRTRLTHTLEVAQIARTLARSLELNEDLCEAISLAHDLGHTPFGHAGQDALNGCMQAFGGFEHNAQSLRVVDTLEDKYAAFAGLNLTFETREGILKHCSQKRARTLGEIGERFLTRQHPTLEAQLANLADEIAYHNHDMDDGVRAGLLTLEQLREVPLFARHHDQVKAAYRQLTARQERHETIRRIINTLVVDLNAHSRSRLAAAAPTDQQAVRTHSEPLIAFSPEIITQTQEMRRFLFQNLYRHPQVHRVMSKAQRVIRELFEAFMGDARLLPVDHLVRIEAAHGHDSRGARARIVADYIAGMTDRYALDEHERLFDLRRLR